MTPTRPEASSAEPGAARLAATIDVALAAQRDLTAVERFAQAHADADGPLLAPQYRDLIPLGRSPGRGQQLAFVVDLDACTGCKACVTACHNLNGLEPTETWRHVGSIQRHEPAGATLQTVTTACHHCEEPACLLGCPARAYEKDATTGIVRHLDDQCIGCQYCLLTCPYDAPVFDASLGIVRKCDMCADRLRHDEAPACVQGCPTSAITIEIVETGGDPTPLLADLADRQPDSKLTRPTTRYVHAGRASMRPADLPNDRLVPNHGHPSLVVLLVFLQLSTGLLLVERVTSLATPTGETTQLGVVLFAAFAAAIGLAASVTHLGRPLQGYRAVLGWRTSWMSREILAFGGYAALLTLALGVIVVGRDPTIAIGSALGGGLVATYCSVQVYARTGRAWWSAGRTLAAFSATLGLLGAAGLTTFGLVAHLSMAQAGAALGIAIVVALGSSRQRRTFLRAPRIDADLERSRTLLRGALAGPVHVRAATATVGLVTLISSFGLRAVGVDTPASMLAVAGFATLTVSALLDRHLFFAAEAARAMPEP